MQTSWEENHLTKQKESDENLIKVGGSKSIVHATLWIHKSYGFWIFVNLRDF